jgi:hypothetical protein
MIEARDLAEEAFCRDQLYRTALLFSTNRRLSADALTRQCCRGIAVDALNKWKKCR